LLLDVDNTNEADYVDVVMMKVMYKNKETAHSDSLTQSTVGVGK